MPTLEPRAHPLMSLLEPVFATLEEDGEIDLLVLPDDGGVQIQADDWTIHLEGWPLRIGFIALDEEPHSREQRLLALDAAVDQRHLAALRGANAQLDGALASALAGSGDDLSMLLAEALADPSVEYDDNGLT